MRPTRLVAAAAATALLAGCGPATQLHLTLRTVAVTVPRILTPALQLVAPAAPPLVPLPPVPPVQTLLPPAVPPPASYPTPLPPAPVACPKASPFAVPKVPAGVVVDHPPAAQGFLQNATGNAPGHGSLAGPVQVTIASLPSATTSNGQEVRSWQVQQLDLRTKAKAVEVYQLLLPSASPLATSPGVYLVGLAWDDPVRGKLIFQPSGNGLYVLPSPVAVATNNTQYAGIATDPNTLTTLELTRNVRARKRIDVCGELVDTWTVEMTGVLTTQNARWNVTWNQQLATGYGAVDVQELFGLADATGAQLWQRTLLSTTAPKEVR